MLLSASLIVWTLPSDSWWRKLLHFIFIIANNHLSFTSIVYNLWTACCVMKFKAVYRLQGSHTLFTYIYIYLYGFCFSATGKRAWWMCGRGPTGTRGSLQNWSVVRLLPASPWSLESLGLCSDVLVWSLFINPTCCTDKDFLFTEMREWLAPYIYCTNVGKIEYVGKWVEKRTWKSLLCQDITQKGRLNICFSLRCQCMVYFF